MLKVPFGTEQQESVRTHFILLQPRKNQTVDLRMQHQKKYGCMNAYLSQ